MSAAPVGEGGTARSRTTRLQVQNLNLRSNDASEAAGIALPIVLALVLAG